MAVWLIEPIRSGRAMNGPTDRLDYVKEGAAKTWPEGSPLVFTAGVAAEAGANPAAIDGLARLAAHNLAAADTVPNMPYQKVTDKGRRLIGNLVQALNTVDVGTTVGVSKDGTTGIWVFDTVPTNKLFRITRIDPSAAATDTYTRLEVEPV